MLIYKFYVENFVIKKHEMINSEITKNLNELNNIDSHGNGYITNSLDEKSNPDLLIDMHINPDSVKYRFPSEHTKPY
jgi:hypothetical protein